MARVPQNLFIPYTLKPICPIVALRVQFRFVLEYEENVVHITIKLLHKMYGTNNRASMVDLFFMGHVQQIFRIKTAWLLSVVFFRLCYRALSHKFDSQPPQPQRSTTAPNESITCHCSKAHSQCLHLKFKKDYTPQSCNGILEKV